MPSTPAQRPSIAARRLELLIVVAVAWALLVTVTGGIDLRAIGVPFRSRNPNHAILLAIALALVYFGCFRARALQRVLWLETVLRPSLARLVSVADRWPGSIACGLALITFVVGVRYGTFAAGGSDAYGYVSQADLWLAGDLIVEQPFARDVPWREADRVFAPLGYRPSVTGGAIVPTYPPGLPVLMALGKLGLGKCGPFLVTPILGALTVWLTFVLGALTWSARVGLAAAALMASSPAFLFALLFPMSDVPATAFLAVALVLALGQAPARAFWTGMAVSMGAFIRPNLVPLAAVLFAGLVAHAPSWRARGRIALQFAAGAAPLLLTVALVNAHLYGAPWKSGYGALGELYSWGFIGPNLMRYPRWLLETETPFVALLVLPLFTLRSVGTRQRFAHGLAAAFVAAVWLSYVCYLPFEAWWTLRFLVPAFPPMLILAVIGWRVALGWLPPTYRHLALGGIVLAVIAAQIHFVQRTSMLSLWHAESDYVSAGAYVRRQLPKNAAILSMLHSGSLRLYSDRLTLRYEWLPGKRLPRAVHILTKRGYRPYILLASVEEAPFRAHFGLSDAADAPGTVIAVLERSGVRVRLYDPLRQPGPSAPVAMPIVVPRLCTGCR
jgi:hypothetical protein